MKNKLTQLEESHELIIKVILIKDEGIDRIDNFIIFIISEQFLEKE